MKEINYTAETVMKNGFPKIKKLGAISPNGEMTPFVWKGKLMRMELCDPTHALNVEKSLGACIRDVESGKIIAYTGKGAYFHSAYVEADTVYVLGVDIRDRGTIRVYESRDLVNWTDRVLLSNPGWVYYNTGLTKGPDGYVLLMEASHPKEHVGNFPFTHFFATSPDLQEWTFMDYELGYSKERYMGGPWLKYSEGYYYMFACAELPCERYTNYLYRTKDFTQWEVGYYNPILMPDEDDRLISPNAHDDLTPELREQIKTGFLSSNSDPDLCDWNGKMYLNYLVGNQHGFYYMAEAEYDGTVAEFLKANFA